MCPSDLQEELQQLKEVNSGLEAQLAHTLGQGGSGQANGLPGDNATLQAANLEVSVALWISLSLGESVLRGSKAGQWPPRPQQPRNALPSQGGQMLISW